MTTTPRVENITGTNLSGAEGVNRTYLLRYAGFMPASLQVFISGQFVYLGDSYSVSGTTITFLGSIYNDQLISIQYVTLDNVSTATGLPRYATTLQLANILGIALTIPVRAAGTTPAREVVGTGNGVTTTFYLAQRLLLNNSYRFYTGGTTELTATTLLTETTHYVLDLPTGTFTLTTAGVTLVSTNKIYGLYSFIDPTYNFTDDYLSDVLIRCESRIDNMVQTTFVSDSQNPDFRQVVRESPVSKGWFDRNYFTEFRPVQDVTSTLASSITSSDVTFTVAAGDGDNYPIAGYVVIESEVIQYSGIASDVFTITARGAFGTTAAAHASGISLHTTVMETSATPEGIAPTFTVLSHDDAVNVDGEVGKIQVYQNATIAPDYIASNLHRFSDIANRIRITYLWGNLGIPRDIERLDLIMAKQELQRDTVGKSVIAGRGEFSLWNVLDADKQEIKDIVANYKQFLMANT